MSNVNSTYPAPPQQGVALDPLGKPVTLGAQGLVAYSTSPLAANATWSTGWRKYNDNGAVAYSISSNVAGALKFEYSENGVDAVSYAPATVPYDPAIVPTLKSGFPSTGQYARVTYVNGSTTQTSFFIEVRFVNQLQATVRTIATVPTSTNIAQLTTGPIVTRDASGAWGHVKRDGDNLLVKVSNPTLATDVSTLATSAKQDAILAALVPEQVRLADGTLASVKTKFYDTALTVAISSAFTAITISAGVNTATVVPAVTGKRIVVLGYSLGASSSLLAAFYSGTATQLTARTAISGGVVGATQRLGYFATAAGQALTVQFSTASAVTIATSVVPSVTVRYVELP